MVWNLSIFTDLEFIMMPYPSMAAILYSILKWETTPWWRRRDLWTEDKASCSIQASRHLFFSTPNLPPRTLSTEHWCHNIFSDVSAPPHPPPPPIPPGRFAHTSAYATPNFSTSCCAYSVGSLSPAISTDIPNITYAGIWTSLPSCRKLGVNLVFQFTKDLTLMSNGGKYVSHNLCWFPKKTSQEMQDKLIVSLHLTIGTWAIRSHSGFTCFQQSAESFEHFTVKILPLIHVNTPWNTKLHHIA